MTVSNLSPVPVLQGAVTCVACTPTLTVHADYATGDYVGTSGAAWEFANAVATPGGWGKIEGAVLIDAVVASKAAELWLFDSAITPPADSAAWTLSDADAATCIGVIAFSTYYASALNSVCPRADLNLTIKAAAGSTSIYGALVTRDAPTYAATGDVKVRLFIRQE